MSLHCTTAPTSPSPPPGSTAQPSPESAEVGVEGGEQEEPALGLASESFGESWSRTEEPSGSGGGQTGVSSILWVRAQPNK